MKKIVTFGEIMLRLAPPGFQRFSQAHSLEMTFGGGEANVAVSLANFGEPVRAADFLASSSHARLRTSRALPCISSRAT